MVLQSANCASTRAKSILSDGEVCATPTPWPPVILAMSNECLASLFLLNTWLTCIAERRYRGRLQTHQHSWYDILYHHRALFILIGHLFSGYNPGGYKSPEELANLDAEDESLARWKASLGIVPGTSSAESGPKVMKSFVYTLHYSLIRLLVDSVDAWACLFDSTTGKEDSIRPCRSTSDRDQHQEEPDYYQRRRRIQVGFLMVIMVTVSDGQSASG